MDWKLIVRKHMFSIVCGAIALVSIIALFYPLSGMFKSLQEDLDKRKNTYSQINSLLSAERYEPSINPAVKNRLEVFPVRAVIDQGAAITRTWSKTAMSFLNNAIQLEAESMLVPLVPSALPNPQASDKNRFRTLYREKLNVVAPPTGVVAGGNTVALTPDGVPANSIYRLILGGTFPPSQDQIRTEQTTQSQKRSAEVAQYVNGQIANKEEVDKAVKEVVTRVSDQLRFENARKGVVYADPKVFVPVAVPSLNDPTKTDQPRTTEIFNAQVWLWIQQDIAKAIHDVAIKNNPEKSVIGSRIKRLMSLTIKSSYVDPTVGTGGMGGSAMGGGAMGGGPPGAAPAPAATPTGTTPAAQMGEEINTAASTAIAFDYRNNPLGHVSNPLYDVFSFQLVILVEVDSLSDVLTELSANRYMSIQNITKISTVDPTRAAAEGYIYGTKPIVQVTIDGQYLLFRPVLAHQFMPAEIKANPVVNTTGVVPGQPGEGFPGGGPMGFPGGDGGMMTPGMMPPGMGP